MNEQEKQALFEAYNKRTHLLGRIVSVITLVLLLGAPFVIGGYLGASPDIKAVGSGFLAIGLVWFVSCIAEWLVYTPMLGAGGGYLAFITGNLINMKIPCAVNATSSLVTILVLALGVLLLIPLQPILQNPALAPAFDNVVPALFGAMAYKYFRRNLDIAAAPLLIMSLLFLLVPGLISSTSFMILPSGALAIGLAWLKYKKQGGSKG